MPYYIDDDMLKEKEHRGRAETKVGGPPPSLFTYVKPWQAETTVLPFSATPGPEPAIPQQRTAYREQQKAASAHALWKVSGFTARCRALGVKRVFGRYDGGSDESFTHVLGIEMSDGRVIPAAPHDGTEGRAQLVENAVCALMGHFGTGPYALYGVVIIDFDACTITDEKNADVVLGDKMPWDV